ncbi:MAG: hypothetical protein CAK89_08560 [Opitutia bacterium AMD-G3]|nr:MAG: hypothetical protein CAK89_08560 [Opitutae bacterium AMD-G3]
MNLAPRQTHFAPMDRPSFQTLLQGLPVLCRAGDWTAKITGLVTDSRRILPGSLFFALPGLRSDGHEYLDDVIARGAAAVISARPVTGLPAVAAAQVADPRKVLAEV